MFRLFGKKKVEVKFLVKKEDDTFVLVEDRKEVVKKFDEGKEVLILG